MRDDNTIPPRGRRKHLGKTVLLVLLVLAVAAGWLVYRLLHTLRGLPDAYAMWDTGTLLIDYMETHQNRWPSGWGDLEESYQKLQPGKSNGESLKGGMTLEQLGERVVVDWHVDTAEVAVIPTDNKRFRPVRPRDGNLTLWTGGDPNQMVWDYLHSHPPASSATTHSIRRA